MGRQGVAGTEKMPFELEVLRDPSREGVMERDRGQAPAVSKDRLMTHLRVSSRVLGGWVGSGVGWYRPL